MLDEITEFAKQYHLIAFGIGGLVVLFLVKVLLQDVRGKWKWRKK